MPVCYAPELGQHDRFDRRGSEELLEVSTAFANRSWKIPVEKDLRTFRPIVWVLLSAFPSNGDAAGPCVPTTGDTARRVSEGPTNMFVVVYLSPLSVSLGERNPKRQRGGLFSLPGRG